MYGYSFPEAGERALQLFQTRQWVEVVEDSLIQNVLLMASVVIGGSAGVFAVVVEETDGYDFTSFHQPIISAFVIGSVLGYVLSNILLVGVVGSAVNTILVCFAAGPFEFDKNHPRLSREMREVWSQQVWEPPL
jgi:multisubunit Na+/H+ antiporter MnhC subunit